MNINPMQNLSAAKGAKTGPDVDALTALGQQLEITPEMLEANPELTKLLEGNPQGLDFEALLNSESGNKLGNVSEMMKGLKEAAGELGEELKATGKDGEVKSIIVDPKNLKNVVKGDNNANQFIPERKSMFDLTAANAKAEATVAKPNPGLQNLSEFVQNQAPSKKIAMKNAYKPAMNDSLFSKKIESQIADVKGIESAPMKIGDLMLMNDGSESGMNLSQNQTAPTNQTTATQNAGKVFDMSQLTSGTTEEVIGKIQDYILQTKASNEPVQMSFEHKELGMIDLKVTKNDSNQLNIMINSRTSEGAKFFTQNQGELLQTLSQAGIQVADLKLDTNKNSNFNQNSDSSMSQNGKNDGQAQQRDQRGSDSKRREELWKLFEGQEAA